MSEAALLDIRQLDYRYAGREVLHGIDLQVAAGEVVCLVGPNGAGKSTLLQCIVRILKAGGNMTLEGRPLASFSRRELARVVAYVPQQTGSAMSLRVIDMIALGRAPHRTHDSAVRDQAIVMDVIERLALHGLALRSYDELSGGERQRVLLARALTQQGRLLLLDEPTSDLDLHHQLGALQAAREIAAGRGAGMLLAIHDLALAARFADRMVMLKDGRPVAQGAWDVVLTPANIAAVYGVEAIVGTDSGLPYVIPVKKID